VVGIAVGAALGGILFAALVGLVWFKRRKQRAASEAIALGSVDTPWNKYGGQAPVAYELAQPQPHYEMDGSHGDSPAELPTATTTTASGWAYPHGTGTQYR
jgi:hypothetical protein